MEYQACLEQMRRVRPRVHCLTNAVTMTDVANVLLSAGGSAIMGQHPEEAAEITAVCQATLLNIGTPSEQKFAACAEAGAQANRLGHPVVLDPVGVGVSQFRQKQLRRLLHNVPVSCIRCNPAEAYTLLDFRVAQSGVESGVAIDDVQRRALAVKLAQTYHCTVLLSGKIDTISDGRRTAQIGGGDDRTRRITGAGCMLSALCALMLGAGLDSWDAVYAASRLWKTSAYLAGCKTDENGGGMGSFHQYLMDAVDQVRGDEKKGWNE